MLSCANFTINKVIQLKNKTLTERKSPCQKQKAAKIERKLISKLCDNNQDTSLSLSHTEF